MFGYYTRLALKSFGRNPGITSLMVLAVALGVAVCVMTLTVYHAMSGNPIWWKNDQLFAVTMDNWDPNHPYWWDSHPPELTYKDAQFLMHSSIPRRKVVMYSTDGVVSQSGALMPTHVRTRVTSADFFAMFDVPFRYGGGWSNAADEPAQPLAVLSSEENRKLFGGANSVGRTLRWNDHEFRIVGVLDSYFPRPRFYDMNGGGSFQEPDGIYIPYGWGARFELLNNEETDCWKPEKLDSYQEFMASECIWQQMWLELPDGASREHMQAYLDGYWAEQRKTGRFQRPRDNRLTNVSGWLRFNKVVDTDNRVLVGLSFAFLAVCLINTIGLLLAKFLNGAAVTGVRRALGASRRQIFAQHLIEVGALSALGALLGLTLAALGLEAVRHLYAAAHLGERGGYQELMHFDTVGVAWAVILALVATLTAGLYPAWRVGRLPPALYLKSQ